MVKVTWSASAGATSYAVLRSTSSSGPYTTLVASTAATSFADITADYLTTYYYEVTASNTAGTSAPTTPVQVTTLDTLFPLIAQPLGPYISLQFPAQSVLLIYRSTSATGPFASIATIGLVPPLPTSYTDTTVTAGTTYYYRLFTASKGWISTTASAKPGLNSVPFNILPNPAGGVLPDALAMPDWMEGTSPWEQSESPDEGPAASFDINLAHGSVSVDSAPDLILANPDGEDITFERTYRMPLAVANLSSPGLPRGWTHNWDYRISQTSTTTWGPVKLVYPSGACDILTPQLDTSGNPTGKFTVPSGVPYIATGVAAADYLWTSITIKQNGTESQTYLPQGAGQDYLLRTFVFDNGSKLNLAYSSGKLTSINNAVGSNPATMQLSLTYGASGGLLSVVTDLATGLSRSITYSSSKLVNVSAIGNGATEWQYGYTTIGSVPYLSSVTTLDPQNAARTASIIYNSVTGRVASLTDASGHVRSYAYSDQGTASASVFKQASDPTPESGFSVAFDGLGRTTSVTTAAGDTTSCQYSSSNPALVTTLTRPVGGAYTLTQDTHGNPKKIVYPSGKYFSYTWEYPSIAPLGRIKSIAEYGSDGASTKGSTLLSYYASGDPDGKNGFLKTITRPNGGVCSYTYTPKGSVATISGPGTGVEFDYEIRNGQGQVIATENYGRPYAMTNGAGKVSRFQYDAAGRMSGVEDALQNSVTATFNAAGQVSNLSLPGGQSLQPTYSAPGKDPVSLIHSVPGNSPLTLIQMSYDSESKLNSLVDADSKTLSATFGSSYGVSAVTNGSGNAMHGFANSPAVRSLTMAVGSGANGLTGTVGWDASGMVKTITMSDGRKVTAGSYFSDPDLVGSAKFEDTTLNTSVRDGYSYDVFGRLKTTLTETNDFWSQASLQHTYVYDNEDHITSDSVAGSGWIGSVGQNVNISSQITYTFNLDGTRKTMLVPLRNTINGFYACYSYGYNLGYLESITVQYADINKNILPGAPVAYAYYTYDDNGRVIVVRTPKAVIFYSYDALGQVTKVQNLTPDGAPDPYAPSGMQVTDPYIGGTHTILSSFDNLTHDARGNLTGMHIVAETLPGTSSTPSTFGTGDATWTYNASGKISGESWSGGLGSSVSNSYIRDSGSNLTTFRSNTWTVDTLTDRIVSSSDPRYTSPSFDAAGNMKSFRSTTSWYAPNGDVTLCGGASSFGGTMTFANYFLYDDAGQRQLQLISTYNQGLSNKDFETYTYDGENLIYRYRTGTSGLGTSSDLSTDPSVLYLWGPTGLIMEFNTTRYAKTFTYDPLGNCVATSDGLVSKPLFFDAYGKIVWPYAGDTRSLKQPFQYKGQTGCFTDGYSSLVYCNRRYYDPESGRWTSRDPIGLSGGVNLYEYCNGMPTMSSDPSGLDALIVYGPDKESGDKAWMNLAAEYGRQYEIHNKGKKAHTMMIGNYDDLYKAFKNTKNIDTFIYVGHSGVPGRYSGPRPDDSYFFLEGADGHPERQDIRGSMIDDPVKGLPTKNVKPGAFMFLMGCGTAATRNQPRIGQYQGPGLAPGTPSMAKRFARHFNTTVYGFLPHVTPGDAKGYGDLSAWNLRHMVTGRVIPPMMWTTPVLGTLMFHNLIYNVVPIPIKP